MTIRFRQGGTHENRPDREMKSRVAFNIELFSKLVSEEWPYKSKVVKWFPRGMSSPFDNRMALTEFNRVTFALV